MSPFNMDWKIDVSAQAVAEAIKTAIDGVLQSPHRREALVLENQAKALELKLKEEVSKSEVSSTKQAQEMEALRANIEVKKIVLQIEEQRLELERERLELEKIRIAYALEVASRVVEELKIDADAELKSMFIRSLLPNILKLDNYRGLELAVKEPLIDTNSKEQTGVPQSIFANAQIILEEGDQAFVGKVYIVQTDLAWNSQMNVLETNEPLTFDIWFLTDQHTEPIIEWHKRLDFSIVAPHTVDFAFEVVEPGPASITIDFYHKHCWLRTIRLKFQCVEKPAEVIITS